MTAPPLWQAEAVFRAVRGWSLHEQNWTATGVSVDSERTKPGDLFIALSGVQHRGQNQIAAAFAAGASAALVSQQPSNIPPDVPLIFVDDTYLALQALAQTARSRARGKIIAITGSTGRASTKNMLRLALGAVGRTYVDRGFDDAQGDVAVALASLPPKANYGIFEMWPNAKGELAALSSLICPDIMAVTTVEAAHLKFFVPEDGAKADIFKSMSGGGTVVMGRDTPHFARMAGAAKSQGIRKILSFSEKAKADAFLMDCALAGKECILKAMVLGKNVRYMMDLSGLHEIPYSLAALLAAVEASGKHEECAAALLGYMPFKNLGGLSTFGLSGEDASRDEFGDDRLLQLKEGIQ